MKNRIGAMRVAPAMTVGLLLWGALFEVQAQPFQTEIFAEDVHTLRVAPEQQWEAAPVVGLEQNRAVVISFDVLGTTSDHHYTYRIVHCNADWKKSALATHEYLGGLQDNPLTDYKTSINTTMDYVHYELAVPNKQAKLKVSGNYVVQIFEEGVDEPLLNACFSVVEPLVAVQMTISPDTDKGVKTKFQAVNFDIVYGNNLIKRLDKDLKVFVFQNNRHDNAARFVKTTLFNPSKTTFEHNPALIFDAGNEYRRFEMVTTQSVGMNVEAVNFYKPYYHASLRPDNFRSNGVYAFSDDLNGKVMIRNKDAKDSNCEADYEYVHFTLLCPQPLPDKVYILSEAFNNLLNSRSEMVYDEGEGGYFADVLLKQGYYNYMYVTQSKPAAAAQTAPIEGDYYQAANEYSVLVYARMPGKQYDQLVGFQTIGGF